MSGDYWQPDPTVPARERTVPLHLRDGRIIPLTTAQGVYGAQRVDRGTGVLVRHAPAPESCSSAVDIGTGYGPIALAMASAQPAAGIWAVDTNRRALDLVSRNAAAAGVHNVFTTDPDVMSSALRFDRLYSHPPVKIGREPLHDLLTTWLRRLAHGGDAYFVLKQSMGADALHSWLNDAGYPTRRVASKQGYRLLHAASSRGVRQPPGLTPADLETVNRVSGRRWSILGRLAGGRADSVQLLGSGSARAVVKIKHGAWWAPQLAHLDTLVTALRAAGYPTPPIIAHGPLGDGRLAGGGAGVDPLDRDRHYLLTEYASGVQPRIIDAGTAAVIDDVAAAIDLQSRVDPRPERDWSAMITLFLNGGIAEHRFPPALGGLAERALRLVPLPVPALPGGEFVHGDLTLRNVLADRGRLSAVIDLEGYGRGTRTIDLVALLASLVGRTDAGIVRTLADRAVAASEAAVFRACVAHRVLAQLLSVAESPGEATAVVERANALIALAE